MRYVTGLFRYLWIFVLIPALVYVVVWVLPRSNPEQFKATVSRWSRRLLKGMGVSVKHTGRIMPPQTGQGLLILSNHCSFIDIFAVDSLSYARFVAKSEIASWPVFGRIARGVRTLFIERGHRKAILQIAAEMEKAFDQGDNVIFFPEGTTSPGDRLLPLHANLIEAAVQTNTEIQPVVLKYTSRGQRTTRMAYTGSKSIFRCLWDIVTTPDAAVEVEVLERLPAGSGDRHQVCSRVSGMMSKALGVADPAQNARRHLPERLAR